LGDGDWNLLPKGYATIIIPQAEYPRSSDRGGSTGQGKKGEEPGDPTHVDTSSASVIPASPALYQFAEYQTKSGLLRSL